MRNLMLVAGLLLAGEACAGSSARVGTVGANAAEALAPRPQAIRMALSALARCWPIAS